MVNGVSMENVTSSFTIQQLRASGKTANIVSERKRQRNTMSFPHKAMEISNLVSGTLWGFIYSFK